MVTLIWHACCRIHRSMRWQAAKARAILFGLPTAAAALAIAKFAASSAVLRQSKDANTL